MNAIEISKQCAMFADDHVYDLAIELHRRVLNDLRPTPVLRQLAAMLAPFGAYNHAIGGSTSMQLAEAYAHSAVLRAFIKDRELKV